MRLALEQMGCDGLQGYLICRPLDDADFRQSLGEHECTRSVQPVV